MSFKHKRISLAVLALLAAATAVPVGCKDVEDGADDVGDAVEDTVSAKVTGRVTDNRGQPVANATVRLYALLDNTDFVEDTDVGSLEALIDKEAVLASDNDLRSAVTKADGKFSFKALPNAFLAVAIHEKCSAGFAGFDEETGVLDAGTLIKPSFKNGLSFSIPTFVLACSEPPPVVEPEVGNTPECPPFEPPPPPPPPPCSAENCPGAFGQCLEGSCVITCTQESCEQSGGSCTAGECVVPPKCDAEVCAGAGGTCQNDECVTPTCNVAECTAARGACSADGRSCEIPTCFATESDCMTAGGKCSEDGASCKLPACKADADCAAGEAGSWCENPGNVDLAKCRPPDPAEIPPPPPMEVKGWTELRITDAEGKLLADASKGDARIEGKDIPEDGLVRVYAKFGGTAETVYLQLQSGSQRCAKLRPRTDFIEAEVENGVLVSEETDYVELMLHGGCQKLQLSTSNVLGQGERSFVVDIGDTCAPPRDVFVAILTYDGGRRRRADLDLNVWDKSGELVHVGRRRTRWGWLRRHGRGGLEVFVGHAATDGPFTVKVQFFSGRPRDVNGKVRILRFANGTLRDETFRFTVRRPKDVAEIGVFSVE